MSPFNYFPKNDESPQGGASGCSRCSKTPSPKATGSTSGGRREARNDEDMESFLQAGYVAAAESKSKRSSKKVDVYGGGEVFTSSLTYSRSDIPGWAICACRQPSGS